MLKRRAGVDPGTSVVLHGRRVMLRAIVQADFEQWRDVRRRNHEWLVIWEPRRDLAQPDTVESRQAFGARCSIRAREIQLGTGYGFGIFVDGSLSGEINVNSIHRGAHQSAYIGYWIDERLAGRGYVPESVVAVLRFCFDDLYLHRLQISIIPRNQASRRVVEKLGLRAEGVAERYLEINGVWEDHIRYAITVEEWHQRRNELLTNWIL
ncbi:MAG: GNAT family N-acetyltransferase [Actinomycetota bacterium]